MNSKDFFNEREPGIFHRFINSTLATKMKLKLLSRSDIPKKIVIEIMYIDNTSCDHIMTLTLVGTDVKSKEESRNCIQGLCSRISRRIDT